MRHGDLVWYRQTCVGGYGFQRDVPGVFIRATFKRVTVQLSKRDGASVVIHVSPENVRIREATA